MGVYDYLEVINMWINEVSNSYAEYYCHLEVANERLLIQYPEIERLNKQAESTIIYKDKF